MESEEIDIFAFKSDQQRPKLVDPGEGSLNRETPFVHVAVEMPLSTAFRRFSATFVFSNVRNNAGIPEQLARSTRVKTTVCIEVRAFIRQSGALQVSKQLLECLRQLICVVMIARNNLGRRKNIPIAIDHGQDIACFGFLAPLIDYAFAPFLATLWLPSRWSSDKFSSPRAEIRLASKRRWRLPSALHFRK